MRNVLNLMTEDGQTQLYKASDHLEALNFYLAVKNRLNFMIVNKKRVDPRILRIYKKEHQKPVSVDEEKCKKITPKLSIVYKDLASYLPKEHLLRHDPIQLAKAVLDLN